MLKRIFLILYTCLLINFLSTTLSANTDEKKAGTEQIIEGTSKIISGAISKVEIALKGKKLKNYFTNNTLNLNFDGKNKEYRFKEKTYEVFIDEKLEENGKWKVHGLIKAHIKLSPDDKSKPYYFKKISKKEIIYLYDKVPGSQDVNKTLVNIDLLEEKGERKKVVKKEEAKEEEPKKEIVKEEEPKIEEPKEEEPKKSEKKQKSIDTGEIAKSIDGSIKNLFGINDNKKNKSSNNEQTLQSHLLEQYKASSNVSYYFFEASVNYLQSLELLYRAYDKNVEADKISSSIDYLKNSKHSETNRLKSTQKIIGTSSIAIRTSIQDASYVLSEQGRTYWEQALPFALGAAESTVYLYRSSKNTLQNVGLMGGFGNIDALLNNANDLGAAITIMPEIPEFTKNMFETVNLIFSAAKEKKIRDKGGYKKALDELQLEL